MAAPGLGKTKERKPTSTTDVDPEPTRTLYSTRVPRTNGGASEVATGQRRVASLVDIEVAVPDKLADLDQRVIALLTTSDGLQQTPRIEAPRCFVRRSIQAIGAKASGTEADP